MSRLTRKCIFNCVIWLFLFISFSVHALTLEKNPYPFSTTADAKRFFTLTKEIRCVVCQNQNIADSNAPLAQDLRNKVYLMVKEKKSNEAIKAYLVQRYGEFILFNPRLNKLTWFLWVFPFLGLFFALCLLHKVNRAS